MHPEDFLSLEEWHELLKATQSTREAALLWLLGGAGLRVSEVASLKVEHLDGPGVYLHVVDGKRGKRRTSILLKPALYGSPSIFLTGDQYSRCMWNRYRLLLWKQ